MKLGQTSSPHVEGMTQDLFREIAGVVRPYLADARARQMSPLATCEVISSAAVNLIGMFLSSLPPEQCEVALAGVIEGLPWAVAVWRGQKRQGGVQ